MAKPVIVSRTRGLADYVVDGETGRFVDVGDVAALRAVDALAVGERLRAERLGANARQAVLGR